MDDALETIGTYLWRGDAEIAKARLAAEGILSFVAVDDEGGLNPGFFNDYRIRLLVERREAARARAALEVEG